MPFPDCYFDAIVSTFVFCVLDDDAQLPALRELRRLCRPQGQIRLLDYRLSRRPAIAAAMKAVSAWSGRIFDSRYRPSTERHLEPAGLEMVEGRFMLGDFVKLLVLRPRP
jgi:ubiquinone/menaquinone biosynthesis C-methylase UbiE